MLNIRELKLKRLQILKEKERRRSLPINTYRPTNLEGHNQLSLHQADEQIRLVSGGNRSGKSKCVAAEIADSAMGLHRFRKKPMKPKKIWVVSVEYRVLYEGIWTHLDPNAVKRGGSGFLPLERIKKIGPKKSGSDVPSYVEVYWGKLTGDPDDWRYSRIDFISVEGGESARRRIMGASPDEIYIDEEVDNTVWEELVARTVDHIAPITIATTIIRGEEWLLNIEDRWDNNDPNVFVTRLDTEANPHLSERGKDELKRNLSKESYQIRIKGQSPRNQGLVYKQEPVLVEPFSIPEEWDRYCAIDPGYRTFAALWIARDPDNDLYYVYRELYMHEVTLDDAGKEINYQEGWTVKRVKDATGTYPVRYRINEGGETIKHRLIDTAQYRVREDGGMSIATQLAAFHKINCAPSDKDIDSGIEAVRFFLTKDKIRVFNDCTNFLTERRKYKIRKDTSTRNSSGASPDKPIAKNDHLMDCWRYLCKYFFQFQFGATNERRYYQSSAERARAQIHEQLTRQSPVTDPYLGTYV